MTIALTINFWYVAIFLTIAIVCFVFWKANNMSKKTTLNGSFERIIQQAFDEMSSAILVLLTIMVLLVIWVVILGVRVYLG